MNRAASAPPLPAPGYGLRGGRRLLVGRQQVSQRLGRLIQHIGIFLHLFLFFEMGIDQNIKLANRLELHSVFLPYALPVFCDTRT